MHVDPRPRPRWHHAVANLDRFALITWATDPDRVRPHLLPGFEPDVAPLDGYGDAAFVSVVSFIGRGFRLRFPRWPRLSGGQVDHRTYVVSPSGERGVWFFGTSLDSPLVAIPLRLWRMPWHREHVGVDIDRGRWAARVDGDFGALEIDLRRCDDPLAQSQQLASIDGARTRFIDPARGWYPRAGSSGDAGEYTVWHEPLALARAEVLRADVALHRRLELVAADTAPLWAGVQSTLAFEAHTPPHRVRVGSIRPPVRRAVKES